MRRIVDETFQIKFPPYVSEPAKSFIGALLERKPHKRLGMLQGRVADIKTHKWFAGFDWEALAARKMPAPRVPKDDAKKRLKELADAEEGLDQAAHETNEELQECQIVFALF